MMSQMHFSLQKHSFHYSPSLSLLAYISHFIAPELPVKDEAKSLELALWFSLSVSTDLTQLPDIVRRYNHNQSSCYGELPSWLGSNY